MLFKLGSGHPDPVPFQHDDVFERQQTSGPERLRIGPRTQHVEVLLDLAGTWESPCRLLYVLLVPRRGLRAAGRYQAPPSLSLDDVRQFSTRFRDFLQNDGRHHLWIGAESGELLVYDRHQWIFAYGDLDAYETVLTNRGLRAGPLHVPVPHSHNYHAEHDADEDALMEYWPWLHSPLAPNDDD